MGIFKGVRHSSTDNRCVLRLECKHLPTAFLGSCMFLSIDTFSYITFAYLMLTMLINSKYYTTLCVDSVEQQRRQKFKVCTSVHHRTIQINHQPDATIFHFIILTFIYSSTCFGRFPARHQELNDCSGSLWFYLRIVVIVVLCSWSGQPARP